MPSPAATRTFICLELPETIRVQAEALQRRLAGRGDQIRWVNPGNLHLTLRFLGEISRSQVETVCLAVRCAAARVDVFSIRFSGTGCFPSLRRPKVFWIGITEATDLIRLFEAIEEELSSAGFPREIRPFSPHLTVGRARVDRKSPGLTDALTTAGFEPASFLVTHVTVMKSDLKKSGAVYTVLARQPLKSFRGSPQTPK